MTGGSHRCTKNHQNWYFRWTRTHETTSGWDNHLTKLAEEKGRVRDCSWARRRGWGVGGRALSRAESLKTKHGASVQRGGQGLGQSGVEEDLGWYTAIVKDEKKGERSGRFPPESPRLNTERQRSARLKHCDGLWSKVQRKLWRVWSSIRLSSSENYSYSLDTNIAQQCKLKCFYAADNNNNNVTNNCKANPVDYYKKKRNTVLFSLDI